MVELKSKKTGKIDIISEEEYNKIKNHKMMSRFTVTVLRIKTLIPSLKADTKLKKV